MMIVGGLVVVSLLPVGIVMGWDHSLRPGAIGWAALILLALAVTLVGCLTLRFELMGTASATSGNPEQRG